MRLELTRGRGGEPDQAVVLAVAGNDLDIAKGKARPKVFRKLDAGRDRMVEAERDQAFGDRRSDQALGRLPRDVELRRDLVLGVAGHVVEPGGARGEVA